MLESTSKLFRSFYYDTIAVWDFPKLMTDMWSLLFRVYPQLLWPLENSCEQLGLGLFNGVEFKEKLEMAILEWKGLKAPKLMMPD